MSDEDRQAEIEAFMSSLSKVEAYCKRLDIAGSALGRTACQDQAILSRWRHNGIAGVSEAKRRDLATYIVDHPEGIPGYKRTGKRKIGTQAYIPNATKLSSSRAHQIQGGMATSTKVPVPALSALEDESDVDYVRSEAFRRGVPMTTILAELVSLGIRVAIETDREENS